MWNVKDWRVWLFSLLGLIVSAVLVFVIVQPTRLWFLVPKANSSYAEMFNERKGDVFVYVMDSGVARGVDEWSSTHTAEGYDAIRDVPGGTKDCVGHGTRVADVVGENVKGDKVTIVPVKTSDCSLVNDPVAIVRGLNWIVDNHPKDGSVGIINMSLGYIDDIPFLDGIQNAVKDALNAGFVVVTSAGNNSKVDAPSGRDEVMDACSEVPANVDGVIAVGAADVNFFTGYVQRAGFSNSGPCISLFAQGVNVMASMRNVFGKVVRGFVDGTSFAAPYVSAAIANKLVDDPSLNREELTAAVKADAVQGMIVSGVGTLLEPNTNVRGLGKTPNLFLEYKIDEFRQYLRPFDDSVILRDDVAESED